MQRHSIRRGHGAGWEWTSTAGILYNTTQYNTMQCNNTKGMVGVAWVFWACIHLQRIEVVKDNARFDWARDFPGACNLNEPIMKS